MGGTLTFIASVEKATPPTPRLLLGESQRGVPRRLTGGRDLRQVERLEPGLQYPGELAIRGKRLPRRQVSCLRPLAEGDNYPLPIQLMHRRFVSMKPRTKRIGSTQFAEHGLCEEIEPVDAIDPAYPSGGRRAEGA